MRTAFSLALALGTLAAVTRGQDDPPTADEQKTVAALAKLKGRATVEGGDLAKDARVAVKFDPASDAQLVALKKYPNVGAVTVADATRCTITGFKALAELPHLRKLVVGNGAQDAVLGAVSECSQLRSLALLNNAGPGLTDTGLEKVTKLTRLDSLDLSGNQRVTDKGMAHVKTLERLEKLYLPGTGLTDKGLAELKPLEGLRALNVVKTRVTPTAVEKFIDEMPNLRNVRR